MSSLIVFDFDFTLFRTDEKIWVWSPRGTSVFNNQKYSPIHPRDITNLAYDETINENSFKEFFDIDIDKCKPIKPVIQHLLYYTEICKEDVIVLTARPQSCEHKIRQVLKNNGLKQNIDIVGLQQTPPEAKLKYIQDAVAKHNYNKIVIYEDNLDVLNILKQNLKNIDLELNLVKNLNNKVSIEYSQQSKQ
tara:strand:- start:1477 stop:2049 length:573 start_codon:yes stop_codon:yes gene_type:complete